MTNQKGSQNNQQQPNIQPSGFSGERLTNFTKSMLLAQVVVSCFLSVMFIINNSTDLVFIKMLTGWMSMGVGILIAIIPTAISIVLLKHIDVLVKEHKE